MGASERDEWLRAAWKTMVAGSIGADRFVFVDECGTNTSLRPLYAWSRRGERAPCSAPRNWGPNVTLLSSMTLSGMGPSLAVEGATTRAVFEAYVEKALAPSLRAGQVVVDGQPLGPQGREDQGAHRGEELRAGLPAALLAGPQPHRAGLLQAQGAAARGRGPQPCWP
ncbi:MAG: transposase [Rubrobacter sp.]|nr:transposase [Rubrobacter sp.]